MLRVGSDSRPYAEAWFSAYPTGPAVATPLIPDGNACDPLALDTLIRSDPVAILGARDAARWKGTLPYLVKILSAARPLSIQLHPDRREAEAGFRSEEEAGVPLTAPHRRYVDPNPKPEVLVARTTVEALAGFRPFDQVMRTLSSSPILAPLLYRASKSPEADRMHAFMDALFDLPDARITLLIEELTERIREDREDDPVAADSGARLLRTHGLLGEEQAAAPADRGLLFFFLLEGIRLEPGDALFVPPGVVHAYLRGTGVEVMAASDNVLRAGLTRKFVDSAELLRIARFEPGGARVLRSVGGGAPLPLPADEFELLVEDFELGEEDRIRRELSATSVETLLLLSDGEAELRILTPEGEGVLGPGGACLLPAGTVGHLELRGSGTLYRTRIPG